MGTDIHLYVERRKADGTWERVRPEPRTCSWCGGTGKEHREHRAGESGDTCIDCNGVGKTTEEYRERNYDLFAMLANVQNGNGFAGCDTGDGFVSLSEPRGLPEDTAIEDSDDDVDYESPEFVSLGDHSFSHCTLAEVFAYDFERTTKHRGIVDARQYSEWVEQGRKGAPKSYCGGISGPKIRTCTNTEMDRRIRQGFIDLKQKLEFEYDHVTDGKGLVWVTTVEWEETYRKSAGEDWFAFLESCAVLGKPEDIRFVFGFDS